MRISEIVVVSYFIYLAIVSGLRPIAPARRRLVMTCAALPIVIVLALASVPSTPVVVGVRDWMSGIYALAGYWLAGMLAGPVNTPLEAQLLAVDRRVFPVSWLDAWTARAPRVVLEYFELAYLFCYPTVPAGFLWLYLSGFPEAADLYWTNVLIALYVCYGLVPWAPTRPPRTIEGATAIDRRHVLVRTINLKLLQHGSIQLNTFPSGHAAGAVATALAVAGLAPEAGLVFMLLALSIMAGSVLGRYHYLADAIAGIAVAIISSALSRAMVSGP
ncbi:MAG: phosphatase PAP2 family protein [Vicinamibacterales bacterium]